MRKKAQRVLEIFALCLIVFGMNAWFFRDPGYSNLFFLPYGLVPILFAIFYGAGWSLVAAGFVLASLIVETGFGLFGALSPSGIQNVAWGISFSILADSGVLFVRFVLTSKLRATNERFRRVVQKNNALQRENRALRDVSLHLESRLSQQKKFLTFLLIKLNRLDQLNLSKALEEVLDTVRIFTSAQKASIWRYHADEKKLVLVSSFGWESTNADVLTRPSEGTIEGWVCKNGRPFSLRMILLYQNLKELDRGENLIAQPIRIGDRVWGVLNVEKLPFVEYSRYTENVIEIILKLAEKSLKPIVDHERLFQQQETNKETGLPLVTVFLKLLDSEIERLSQGQGVLSIVVVEIVNSSDLLENGGQSEFQKLLLRFAFVVKQEYEKSIQVFHYKEVNQIAFYVPDLDTEGAALFCLNVLGSLNTNVWKMGDRQVFLEAVVGYSTLRPGITNSQALVEQVETIISMQKV